MPQFDRQIEAISASDRQAWREWLEQNHLTSPGIWLIYYKVNKEECSLLD